MPSNSKIEYDARVPAFLQRLKGQVAGSDGRNQAQHARAKKDIIDREDDGPTYVDEVSNETISKEDFHKLTSGEETSQISENDAASEEKTAELVATTKPGSSTRDVMDHASVGTSLKRKHIKTIGHREDDEPQEKIGTKVKSDDIPKSSTTKVVKQVKKGKKIKLSFEDQE